MPELGKQMTFVELLKSCEKILVPRLQRDYAQGRDTAKEVREGFLNALHEALNLTDGDKTRFLNLDFIYGSIEQDGERYFLPLDGQQRLTTLFLLHWYLAWLDGDLLAFQAVAYNKEKERSRFTYALRPSSTEFFDELARYIPGEPPKINHASVRYIIEDQPWFYLHWRLDPTVQSALTMLDAIHVHFANSPRRFAQLLDTERPVITFQLLPLEHFGLSDDLYIKMNARGKPLTPFETFKARFEEHLKELFSTERIDFNGTSISVHDFFSKQMDTRWTDLFWGNRTTNSPIFDEEAMNFFWVVAWASIDPEWSSGDGTTVARYREGVGSYAEFDKLKLLTREFAVNLIRLLVAWSKGIRQLPDGRYFKEAEFFKKARTRPAALVYSELVMFAAYTYLISPREVNADGFQEWMRVVYNLVQNSDIERPDDFQRSLGGLMKLRQHGRRILEHLASADLNSLGFNQQQLQEESLKAQLLLADAGWGSRIRSAESHGYFRGQISFLLDFSGVAARAGEKAVKHWDPSTHRHLQDLFDVYLKKAQITFDQSGLREPNSDHLWRRALLATGDYLLPVKRNRSFLTNPAGNPDSWKRFLRDSGPRRQLLKNLWDALDADQDIASQLAAVIDKASDLEPWRSAVVHHPQVIDYCKGRKIRQEPDDQDRRLTKTYLLSKEQMNGAHAELFSFALHTDLTAKADGLRPLILDEYSYARDTYEQPCMQLRLDHPQGNTYFTVRTVGGRFLITMSRPQLEPNRNLHNALKARLGFTEDAKTSKSWCSVSRESVDEVLRQIADTCKHLASDQA
jgi:hypothetical protein